MTEHIVGDVRTEKCGGCNRDTDQELYHTGDWICLVCGEFNE